MRGRYREKQPAGAAACLAAVLLLLTCLLAGCGARDDALPPVKSAEEAIALLQDRGAELGYENALSELTEQSSVMVSGDRYYRLQQNYQGIPVYGREVVFCADEKGNMLAVTQNIQDVSGNLNLSPTVKEKEVRRRILAYLEKEYPDNGWDETTLGNISLKPEALCIYNLDGSDHLAYALNVQGLCFLSDAHTGEVLHTYPAVCAETASFGFSDEELEVPRLPNGDYVLKDEEYGIYVYSAQKKTYISLYSNEIKPNVLQQVTSRNPVFGDNVSALNRDDSVDDSSMIRAKESLYSLRRTSQYFTDLTKQPQFEELVLVYDDLFGLYLGGNAAAAKLPAVDLLGSALPDHQDPQESLPIIILGSAISKDPWGKLDVVAHEYTHLVTNEHVDWTRDSDQNKALNEAFSDIFGELVQASVEKREPDWNHDSDRFLSDPGKNQYPVSVDDPIPTNTDYAHGASTIISHTAYMMWNGINGTQSKKLSVDELEQLWYRTMLMLPPDSDFADCRYAVEIAAEAMGLSDNQKLCIRQAFDNAGIAQMSRDPNVDFQVKEKFTIHVYDAVNTPCTNCRMTLWKKEIPYGPGLSFAATPVSADEELELAPGYYTLTVSVSGVPSYSKTYTLQVMPDNSGRDSIHIYVHAGKVMLDVEVYGNENGTSVPLSDATVEIYRDNPNRLIHAEKAGNTPGALHFYLPPDKYTVVVTAPGYVPDQVTLSMRDITVPYGHTFLLEPREEGYTGGSGVVPRGTEGPVKEDLENITCVHRVGSRDNTNYYTFYPILSGDAAGLDVINQDLYNIAQEFMQQKTPEEVAQTHYAYGRQFCFSHTQAFVITHNGDGLISFRISEGGFWGNEEKGRYDIYYGRTYHLGTGQILSITDLVDMDTVLLDKTLRENVIENARYRRPDIDAEQSLAAFDLETIPFWVQHGMVYVTLFDDPHDPYHTYGIETGILIS